MDVKHVIHFRNKEGKRYKICFMRLTNEFCPFPYIELWTILAGKTQHYEKS